LKIGNNTPPPLPLKGKKICLDPGHGGKDPGAVGVEGTKEKDVNLQIALKEKALLEESGAKVVMTRTSDPAADSEVTLKERVDTANDADADIFISIHHNAAPNPEAKGTETYYYGHGSKESYTLSKLTQNEVVDAIGTESRGAFPSNFYVVKYTKMPAILLEVGFLSNRNEEKFLIEEQTQDKVAEGMRKAIISYFTVSPANMENPPAPKPGEQLPDTPPGDPVPARA
jgi:N-acetylmuramoyl-L-alanine amidase